MQLTKNKTADGQDIYSAPNPITGKALYAIKNEAGKYEEINAGMIEGSYKTECKVSYDGERTAVTEQTDKTRFIVSDENTVIGIHRADLTTKGKVSKTTPQLTISRWALSKQGKWSNYSKTFSNAVVLRPSDARALGAELTKYADKHSPITNTASK